MNSLVRKFNSKLRRREPMGGVHLSVPSRKAGAGKWSNSADDLPLVAAARCLTPLAILITLLIGAASPKRISAADQYVVVVLDDSGSMGSTMRNRRSGKMQAAKQALQTVLADVPDEAEVGVLALNSMVNGSKWVAPLGPVDRTIIQRQIAGIRADGNTPLGAAMKAATDALLEKRAQNVYGIYRLLIVTDGEATDQNLVEKYLPDIRARGVVTDVIGVDMKSDHSLATQVNTYRRADDPESLRQAIAQVFAETSDEDTDAGASDYDLLVGLDDDVASAAVTSLAKISNQPIGEANQQRSATSRPPPTTSPAPPTIPRRAPTPQRPAERDGGSGLGAVCTGLFIMFLLMVAFMVVASKLGRSRKN